MKSIYPENDYRSYLMHSAKGQTWANHKYIAIKNGRYIYPDNGRTFGEKFQDALSADLKSTAKKLGVKTSDSKDERSTSEKFEDALAADLKNTFKKQIKVRTDNAPFGSLKFGKSKSSKIAKILKYKGKLGGRTTTRKSVNVTQFGSSSRKF